jgi:hypothetical protein
MAFIYETGAFDYTYTHISGDVPTTFTLKWGSVAGTYPNTHLISASPYTGSHPYVGILPGPGHYHAILVATSGSGDGSASADVEVDLVALTNPTVTITSPTSATTYSTNYTPIVLGGTAATSSTPGSTVTGVAYYNNTRSVGGACTGTTTWTSPGIVLNSGVNNITVTVTSSDGYTGTDTIAVTYISIVDPTLTITSPTSNPTYTSAGMTLTLGGTATPSTVIGSTITGVQYFNSTTSVGAACTGTTAWTSPTITLVSGPNNISVWCTTSDGRTGTDTIVVTAPITNPTLTITGPTSNPTYSLVSQYVNLYGSATPSSIPGSTVVSVQYYNDQTGVGGVCAGTTSWGVLVGPLVTGVNHISVWSTTSDGRSGADAIDVTSIAVPTITITAPTSDPTYATATASIDLAGSATPSSVVGSTITSVAYLHSETSDTAPCTGTTSWVSPTIALIPGVNTIVLTVTTSDPLTAQDTIVVTYTLLPPIVIQGNLLVLCVM